MHLLITSVGDVTSDLLCERLGDRVLRLNWERWHDYRLRIEGPTFELADSYGRRITPDLLENIIWRKPVPEIAPESGEYWYSFQEFKYAIEYIVDCVRRECRARLPIDPRYNATVHKFRQLQVASRHMSVPRWLWTMTPSLEKWVGTQWVAKSLTGEPVPGTGIPAKVIYTSDVVPTDLADGFPWFLQERVEADRDLTVVYVDGRQFGFELDRTKFTGRDWRRHIGDPLVEQVWRLVELPTSLAAALDHIMQELGLRFGRIDLLIPHNQRLDQACFLEVNPNGQWAWLDLKQDNGLFDAVVCFLTTTGSSVPAENGSL